MTDLVLCNAVVHTMTAAAGPKPDSVAVTNARISAVGRFADTSSAIDSTTTVIDCGGSAIVPGLVDEHCHLFAQASRYSQVDCRPSATPDVNAVVSALRSANGSNDNGWIRGYGYDDSTVGLGRHLNRYDLDEVSTTRPVRVEHRSGHACVLNTAGLTAVGINRHTPDPPGGAIVRDSLDEPTGLLLEMTDWLSQRKNIGDAPDPDGLTTDLQDPGRRLLRYGITAATDAGPRNGLSKWNALANAISAERFQLRTTMMVGIQQLDEMCRNGLQFGATACGEMLRVGHAKIMLTASGGYLHPDPIHLAQMVTQAHELGFPVAIHAVERDAVVASAIALIESGPPPAATFDRIEHCAECPPDVAELVARSGATVVSNPGFLHYDGARYRQTVESELLHHLYPVGALSAIGVPVMLGSDAPVVDPNPWAGIVAAVARKSADGHQLGGTSLANVSDALRLYTRGGVALGAPADLAVVAPDPITSRRHALPSVRSVLTVVAGSVVFRDGI